MPAAPATIEALLSHAAATIGRVDAEWLLAHAVARPRSWLFAHAGDPVPPDAAERFETLRLRRHGGEPVAYLTGTQGFWTLELEVSPATLVPRPETELLVELALARIAVDAAARIADLGTGSGAIALAIARERPRAAVIATDASAAALQVARRNAARNRIANIEFREGDWLAPLAGETCDLIASNPPYIAEGDPHLGEGDLRFEPASALSSGADGLDALRAIIRAAPGHLRSGGWLLLEHGWEQGEPVRTLLHEGGFIDIETARDLEDRERTTFGRWR